MKCQASTVQRHPIRKDVEHLTVNALQLTADTVPLSLKHGQGKSHHRHRPGTYLEIVTVALVLILSERARAVTMYLRSF